MSKPAEVIQALLAQLQASTHLSNVNNARILLGKREEMLTCPAIIIEPLSISEGNEAYPRVRNTINVLIVGFLDVKNKDKQIVGDSSTPGILDFENDIKLALDDDNTLAGKALAVFVKDSVYDFVDYPIRSVGISVDILFEQTKGSRA